MAPSLGAKAAFVSLSVAALLLGTPASSKDFKMQAADANFEAQIVGPRSREARAEDWPATFVFLNENGVQCTATAVGTQTILTAAHCLPKSVNGTIQVGTTTLGVSCEKHGDYPAIVGADFALCLTDSPMKAPSSGFETVNTQAGLTPEGTEIRLIGFGCRLPGGEDLGFGRLAEGDAVVLVADPQYLETGGGAAICTGDSGGGAYLTKPATASHRRLIAVNSHGDLNDRSYLSVTASKLFLDWAKSWSQTHGVTICGIEPGLMSCRESTIG